MGKLAAALSIHRLMRRLQAAYRRKRGKEPTQLPGEGAGTQEGDSDMLQKLMGLFVGQDSQKAPMAAGLTALYGIAALFGFQIPGAPMLTQEAAVMMAAGGLYGLFLAFRVTKSGLTR